MEVSFKKNNSFEKRKKEASNVLEKYPDRIPIIVQKHSSCELPEIDKSKYLVPKDMNMSQFSFIIRKRIKLESSQAIFITIGHSLAASNKTLDELYHENKDEDGFLYMIYTNENTFG
jgi:GABA(A) receptor-associated protein